MNNNPLDQLSAEHPELLRPLIESCDFMLMADGLFTTSEKQIPPTFLKKNSLFGYDALGEQIQKFRFATGDKPDLLIFSPFMLGMVSSDVAVLATRMGNPLELKKLYDCDIAWTPHMFFHDRHRAAMVIITCYAHIKYGYALRVIGNYSELNQPGDPIGIDDIPF